MPGLPRGRIASIENIWSLSTDLLVEVQRLVAATRNSLIVPKQKVGEMDIVLEKALNDFANHLRQYETEFLHLLAHHVNVISSALNVLLEKMKKGQKVDPKLIARYSDTLNKINEIFDNVKKIEIVDIQKARILAYDAGSLRASVQKKINEITNTLTKIQRKQEGIFREQQKAIRKGFRK